MATLNMLGPYAFRNFINSSPPGRINESLERIDVPGIDYSLLRKMGYRSEQFEFETIVDAPSYPVARLEYWRYSTTVGAEPARLIWAGYNYDIEKLRFAVMNVTLVSIQRKLGICGGLYFGNTYDLHAKWSGILVPTT